MHKYITRIYNTNVCAKQKHSAAHMTTYSIRWPRQTAAESRYQSDCYIPQRVCRHQDTHGHRSWSSNACARTPRGRQSTHTQNHMLYTCWPGWRWMRTTHLYFIVSIVWIQIWSCLYSRASALPPVAAALLARSWPVDLFLALCVNPNG